MVLNISSVIPPDDSGSDSFRRYCYQAHVAFPFCLDCALDGDIISIVVEHIEDIAIERVDRWQFLQVKTRNPELGPWRLTHLTEDGGALHSALRSHRALPDAALTIEICLEGSLRPNDDIVMLRTDEGRCNPALQSKIQTRLQINSDECAAFLARVRLNPELCSRGAIIDRNIRALGNHAPHLPLAVISEIYGRVIERIYSAMAQDLLDPAWFAAVLHPQTASSGAQRTYAAKRLGRNDLRPLVAPITAQARSLLKRIIEPEKEGPSVLEQKLLVGGASSGIVETAKNLRANAAIAEFENAAASLWDEDNLLEDVRERLRLRIESLLAVHENTARPAIVVWASLLERLSQWADTIDGYGLFRKDPDLLLGEICQMADLCLTDWGRSDAQ